MCVYRNEYTDLEFAYKRSIQAQNLHEIPASRHSGAYNEESSTQGPYTYIHEYTDPEFSYHHAGRPFIIPHHPGPEFTLNYRLGTFGSFS